MGRDKWSNNSSRNDLKSNKSAVKFKNNVEIFQVNDSWQVRMERANLKNENQQATSKNYKKLNTKYKK